jgi:hypothetical protein
MKTTLFDARKNFHSRILYFLRKIIILLILKIKLLFVHHLNEKHMKIKI